MSKANSNNVQDTYRKSNQSERSLQHSYCCFRLIFTIFLAILLLTFGSDQANGAYFRERIGYHNMIPGGESINADQYFNYTKQVGDWTLFGISWFAVQSLPSSAYNFSQSDLLLESAIRSGIDTNKLIIQLLGHPPFVRLDSFVTGSDPFKTYSALKGDSLTIRRWQDYCTALATHFFAQGIRHYEIGNEPNGNQFYKIFTNNGNYAHGDSLSIVTYPKYLDLAREAMQNVSETIVILGGALAPIQETHHYFFHPNHLLQSTPSDFLRSLYSYRDSLNIQRYFDVLSYHPYGPFWGSNMSDSLCADPLYYRYINGEIGDTYSFMVTEKLNDIMCENGDSDKQIWGTECGPAIFPETPNSCVDLERQGYWADRYLQKWTTWDFTGPLLWWNVRSPGWPDTTYYGWGAMDSLWTPRPAYLIWEEWGSSNNELFTFHIGEGSDFLHHDLDADLAARIKSAAAIADTVRIFVHANEEPYYGSLSFLDLETLPANAALEHLEILGVGASRSSTEAATPGAVILDALGDRSHLRLNGQIDLTIRNITFQHVYNSDTPREGDPNLSVSSMLHSAGGAVHLESCQFIDISTGGTGVIDPGGVLSYVAPEGVSRFVTIKNCLFVDCAGPEAGVADVTRGNVTVESCTFHKSSGSSSGNCSIHATSGSAGLLNCLFTGSSDGSATSVQLTGGGSLQASYCLFDTQASGYNLTGVGNQFVTPGEAMERARYVDADQGDYRLRWDSACLDRGDPDPAKLDFDLTYQDIGWSPRYRVTEISGTVPLQQRGWYKVVGNTTLTGGTDPDLVIPDGTIILCDGAYEMVFRDTDPSNGHRITVGSLSGARTSLVSHELGNLTFGSTTTAPLSTAVTTYGVLFNRGPNWCTGGGFVWFNTCDVEIDGQGGNTKFNRFDETAIYLDNDCGGTIRNLNFDVDQAFPSEKGIGQIDVFGSGLIIDNVTFDPITNLECYFDHKIAIGFMNPNATANVISNCQFIDAEPDPGKSLVFLYGCNSYWHHNVFNDVRDAAIYMSCCTARMNNIAANAFSRITADPVFYFKPIIKGYTSYLDLNCGYNSFTDVNYDNPSVFVTASTGTSDWSSNFWGRECGDPRNPVGHIPTFVTNVSPTLSDCPTTVFGDPCGSQQSQSALYTAARSAHTNGNYPAAISYWNELLLLYPYTPNSMEACNAMKAIGVWTEFGAESYSAIASMLDTIAVVSLPLNAGLSLHEFCNGLCVAGRHGDRQAVISSFDSLLVVFAGKKDEVEDIQISKAEVLGYPLQGQSSALADPFATRAHRRLAIHNLLNVMAGREENATGTVLEAAVASQPATFRIRSVHPNPFNPVTTLELELSRESLLRVEVFNLMGQRVASVHDGLAPAGGLHLAIDGAGWASGVYFVRVQVGRQMETRKMLLAR